MNILVNIRTAEHNMHLLLYLQPHSSTQEAAAYRYKAGTRHTKMH